MGHSSINRVTERQRRVLRLLGQFNQPVKVTELQFPKVVMPLAQHGYIILSAEITEKGRKALEEGKER